MPPVKGFGAISAHSRRENAAIHAPVHFQGLSIVPPDSSDRTQQGGKAVGLARLAEAGVTIPPSWVIPTSSFEAFLKHHDFSLGHPPHPDAVQNAALPDGWASRLVALARTLGTRLAVRSSAVDEDGHAQSFAGVHSTVLGVTPEGVPDAVRKVWASAFAPSAQSYGGRASAMAVVLQPLIEPHSAGVVFTVNPQSGSWRELVVEAVRGQGEALVSGRQAPQWALVRRPRDLPGRRVWNRLRLRISREDQVPQEGRWQVGSNGQLHRIPLPHSEHHARLLSRRQLLALCRDCLRIESSFGEPLDIEWCHHEGRFTFLQARPITRTGTPRGHDVLWTRRFIGERFPHPPTPLSWSLLSPLLSWFIAYPDVQNKYLGGGPPLRRSNGHPYLNTTVFRHLLFKLPGAPAPSFMLELIPPDEVDDWRRRFQVRADWSVYRAIFATTLREKRWQRFAFNPFTNHQVWDAFEADLHTQLDALAKPLLGTGDALQRVEAHQALVTQYLSIHVTSLLFANLWYQLLDAALASWAPGHSSSWMGRLAVCPPGNKTLETNHALWRLGQHARPEDRDALAQGEPLEEPFASELRVFLDRYGHRAEASWEIFSPRWKHEPHRLASLLGSTTAPHLQAGEQEDTLKAAQRELLGAIGPAKAWVLDGILFFTRRYLLLRENQRFAFDQLLASQHQTLLALATFLEISPPEDIQWMTWDEVRGRADGTLSTLPDVARRKSTHAAQLREDPPVFLRGDQPVEEPTQGARLQGLGISPGRIRGRVRVLQSAAEGARLEDGEILVAPALDPGWTPLLGRTGGLVLELGSLLSHGAVVAREYGVPGVVNLSGVTRRLRTGQEVTVDGSRGLVWVHS